MKALGVLGLAVFTAGFWTTVVVLACGGREAEVASPEPAAKCCKPDTDVFLETTFPVVEPETYPLGGEVYQQAELPPDVVIEGVEVYEDPADSAPRSASAFLSDPLVIEQMLNLEKAWEAKLGPDGRLTVEESTKRIAALEASYLSEEGEIITGNRLSRPLLPEERKWLIEEDRNGWGGTMTEGFEHWLKEWKILIPGTEE